MKNSISFPTFKSSFILLAFGLLLTSFCQAQNVWVGGVPGDETNWNNPRNWSQNQVPDWSDLEVVIPNTESASGYFPIIKNEVEEINYLNIQSGAEILIESDGVLTVNGEMTYNYGIQNIGKLNNFGKLIIKNTGLASFSNPGININNEGLVTMETEDGEELTWNFDAVFPVRNYK